MKKFLVSIAVLLILPLVIPQFLPSRFRPVLVSPEHRVPLSTAESPLPKAAAENATSSVKKTAADESDDGHREVFVAFVPFYKWKGKDGVDGFEMIVKDPRISEARTTTEAIKTAACAPGTPYNKTTCSQIPELSLGTDGTLKTVFNLRNETYKDLPKNPGAMAEGMAKAIGKLSIKKAIPLERRLATVVDLDITLELDVEANSNDGRDSVTITKRLAHVPAQPSRGFKTDAARIFDPGRIKQEIDKKIEKKAAAHLKSETIVIPDAMPGTLTGARFVQDPYDQTGHAIQLLFKRDLTLKSTLFPSVLFFKTEISANDENV